MKGGRYSSIDWLNKNFNQYIYFSLWPLPVTKCLVYRYNMRGIWWIEFGLVRLHFFSFQYQSIMLILLLRIRVLSRAEHLVGYHHQEGPRRRSGPSFQKLGSGRIIPRGDLSCDKTWCRYFANMPPHLCNRMKCRCAVTEHGQKQGLRVVHLYFCCFLRKLLNDEAGVESEKRECSCYGAHDYELGLLLWHRSYGVVEQKTEEDHVIWFPLQFRWSLMRSCANRLKPLRLPYNPLTAPFVERQQAAALLLNKPARFSRKRGCGPRKRPGNVQTM